MHLAGGDLLVELAGWPGAPDRAGRGDLPVELAEEFETVRFAKRLDAVPPYLFAELERKLAEAEQRAGVDVISLGIGDPDLPTPPPVVDALRRGGARPATHQYPTNHGTEELREAAAATSTATASASSSTRARRSSRPLGGKEGVGHIALALLDPGDVCLSPDPGLPAVHVGPAVRGRRAVHYLPLREENGFLPDLDAIADARRAKLL